MPDREKVIKALECCGTGYYGDIVLKCYECLYGNGPASDCRYNLHQDALALLKEQETANLYKCPNCSTWVSAENVVRCKDCKWNSGKPNIPYCQIRSEPHRNDWFCADGERQEGGEAR